MPISLEPDKRFPIVLDCDKDKPKELRPTFYALSKTMSEHVSLMEFVDNVYKDNTVAGVFDAICGKLDEVIVGWENMGRFQFGRDSFASMLTHLEAMDLLRKVAHNAHLEPEEKKS